MGPCSYSDNTTKIKQRRHFSLLELFIDGTEIVLINDNNKSFKLPNGLFISSTEENKDEKRLTAELEKVRVISFNSKPLV